MLQNLASDKGTEQNVKAATTTAAQSMEGNVSRGRNGVLSQHECFSVSVKEEDFIR